MLRVMLDTNVLVKFAFVYNKVYSKTEIPKNLKRFEYILGKLENAKVLCSRKCYNKYYDKKRKKK